VKTIALRRLLVKKFGSKRELIGLVIVLVLAAAGVSLFVVGNILDFE